MASFSFREKYKTYSERKVEYMPKGNMWNKKATDLTAGEVFDFTIKLTGGLMVVTYGGMLAAGAIVEHSSDIVNFGKKMVDKVFHKEEEKHVEVKPIEEPKTRKRRKQ